MSLITLVETADGSSTFYNAAIGEHYHSKHGALQESKHVFIKSGLEFSLTNTDKKKIDILEIGFGTGLNFLLTAEFCTQRNIKLSYTSIEAYPLTLENLKETNYKDFINADIWESFTSVYVNSLSKETPLNSTCKLQIYPQKLMDYNGVESFDLIYFDAFAAIHQPEMWTNEALYQATKNLRPNGVFVTYAITGNLKRSIKSLGFSIEKAPGAPGKREMLRAIKLNSL